MWDAEQNDTVHKDKNIGLLCCMMLYYGNELLFKKTDQPVQEFAEATRLVHPIYVS